MPYRKVDPNKLSQTAESFRAHLEKRIIGQERAVRQLVKCYTQFEAGFVASNRPVVTLLFLGPTGVGKSELVHATAEALLGKRDALTRVDCSEFQHSHEISKLIGSPPGYLGFHEYSGDNKARLAQRNLDQYQTETAKINVLLFDEIEKAHNALHDILLGILDCGSATMGNGDRIDFTRTIVIMTSNLGSRETHDLITGAGIGFDSHPAKRRNLDDKIWEKSKATVAKHFRPEFLNRIDRTIVFHSLSGESLRIILDGLLAEVQDRIFHAGKDTLFTITDAAKRFLVREGTSETFGARELKRTVERFVAQPIASLLSNGEMRLRDDLVIDHEGGAKDLAFFNVGSRIVLAPAPDVFDLGRID